MFWFCYFLVVRFWACPLTFWKSTLFIYWLRIGEGNGNPQQYPCLENPMDKGAWQATVHGVARVGYDSATKPPLRIMFACLLFSSAIKESKKKKMKGICKYSIKCYQASITWSRWIKQSQLLKIKYPNKHVLVYGGMHTYWGLSWAQG